MKPSQNQKDYEKATPNRKNNVGGYTPENISFSDIMKLLLIILIIVSCMFFVIMPIVFSLFGVK